MHGRDDSLSAKSGDATHAVGRRTRLLTALSAAVVAMLLAARHTRNAVNGTCGGTSNGADCMFPFEHDGIVYGACTTVDHDQPWCITDSHGNWGNCICTQQPRGVEPLHDPSPARAPVHWLERGRRVSESALWRISRESYRDRGAEQWSSGDVPTWITTGSHMARMYADVCCMPDVRYMLTTGDVLPRSLSVVDCMLCVRCMPRRYAEWLHKYFLAVCAENDQCSNVERLNVIELGAGHTRSHLQSAHFPLGSITMCPFFHQIPTSAKH
jgi:hypothetical protein